MAQLSSFFPNSSQQFQRILLQREKYIFSSLENKFLMFNHFGTLLWLPEKNKTQHGSEHPGVSLMQAQMESNIRRSLLTSFSVQHLLQAPPMPHPRLT